MDKLSWFGITGALLVMLAVAYSAGVYRGRQGESFSLLNHFISELGEVGVSPGARIFNTTLIVGGLLFLPFIFGLGLALGSLLGGLGTLAGLVAGLALAAVGIFPMNDSENHSRAALLYFRAGLGMVIFLGLAILFQPAGRTAIPMAANLLSLLAAVCYATYLLLVRTKPQEDSAGELEPESSPDRPRFWLLPTVEWGIFFSTILWLFGMALAI